MQLSDDWNVKEVWIYEYLENIYSLSRTHFTHFAIGSVIPLWFEGEMKHLIWERNLSYRLKN